MIFHPRRNPTPSTLFLVFAILAAFCSANLLAQTPAPQPSPARTADAPPAKTIVFDVVSIKVNKSGNPGNSGRNTDDGFIDTNWTLRNLIGGTYGNRFDLISGLPGWAESIHYDVQAKVAPEDVEAYRRLRGAAAQRVYQQLLEDYFKLKAHIELKEMPVYELVIAKGGPKFLPSGSGDGKGAAIKLPNGAPLPSGGGFMGRGELAGSQMPISFLLNGLQGASGRGVVDKTGLTGKYDLVLKWKPDQSPGSDDTSDEPDIFTALTEQLGLKLQPAMGPVKSLVVDHVEMPPEN